MNVKISESKLKYVLFIFILSGYVYLIYGQAVERIFLVLAIFFLFFSSKKITRMINGKINILGISHTLFILSFILSAILYTTVSPLIYGFCMLIVYFLCKNVMEKNASIEIYGFIIKSVWIISLVVLILSVLFSPISSANYSGIFGNPNGLGTFCATLGGTLAAILAHNLYCGKKRTWWMWIYYIVAVIFCIISSCRTALIIIAFQVLLLGIAWFKGMRLSQKKFTISLFLFFIGISLLLLLNTKFQLFDSIYDSIIEKFFRLAARDDFSNGRTDIWKEIFNGSALFGDGTMIIEEIAAHNVYFGLINRFGKVCGLLYLLVVIIICFQSVCFTFKYPKCPYGFFPIMMAANFFASSMFENFLLTPSMILFYLCISMADIYMPSSMKLDNTTKI